MSPRFTQACWSNNCGTGMRQAPSPRLTVPRNGWRRGSDFADAFVGPWTYELAAPTCFTTRGDPAARDALVRGLGRAPDRDLARGVRAWAVLHRYGHLARMLAGSGCPDLASWLDTVWPPA